MTQRTAIVTFKLTTILLAAMALQGCATVIDSSEQQLEVRAVLDHREVAGVGCVLTNPAGRWFVVAPGRVTIRKSRSPLAVDCKKEGAGAASEIVDSKFGIVKMVGNAVTTAGLGYLVDRETGAGFDYPATLTVLMRRTAPDARADDQPGAGTTIY
jgi:MinD superfamily P-loop ATPase